MVLTTPMDQGENSPKWLLELENRKRKPRLAHEVGAGAPCIKCTGDCPGLDLHFWRKICKNCKCGRDDHDVPDDEFPQFDLLFGPTGKTKRRAIVLKVKDQQTDETFEWAPPNTTKELAADYMKALPEDKLPIKGSAGAALRKQQLQKQLPLHDIDHKMCDELTESERVQFEKYLENLKKYVGQGKVSKVMGAKPFAKSLITPANASECFTPKHRPSQPVNLRTPSSFVPKSNYSTPLGTHESSFHQNHGQTPLHGENTGMTGSFTPKSVYSTPLAPHDRPFQQNYQGNDTPVAPSDNFPPQSIYSTPIDPDDGLIYLNQDQYSQNNDLQAVSSRLESIRRPLFGQTIEESPKFGRYHHLLANVKNEADIAGSVPIRGTHNPPMHFGTTNKIPQDEKYSCIPQSSKFIKSQGLPNREHSVPEYSATTESPRSSINTSSPLNKSQNPAVNFAQSNLHGCDVLSSLPYASQLQKLKGTKPESASIEQVYPESQQWPGALTGSRDTAENDENSRLVDKMLSDALLPPSSIHSSDIIGSTLDEKGLSHIREKLSAKYSAKEAPVELENLMKPRDFGRLVNENKNFAPNGVFSSSLKPVSVKFSSYGDPENSVIKSETLQNPIFPEEAVGTSIVMQNPIVDRLNSSLENLSVSPVKPQTCHECKEVISIGDVVVTAEKANDAKWHPGCFVCSACNELLVDLVYFYYKGKLYCGRDLACLLEIPRCFACDELIFVREYTVAEGHNYHVKHFCCWDCDLPLAGKQYTSENDRPLCLPCYQKTYANSCSHCGKVIAADQQGVAVKNLNFHATPECFCCANCNKSLLNGRMAIKEEKPFCSKECITTYMNHKKC